MMRSLAALAVLLSSAVAYAHDPLELTSTARVRPELLELELTMSRTTAQALLRDDGVLNAAGFGEKLPQLRRLALRLFEVTSGTRRLEPLTAGVRWSPEHDLEFVVTYERPPAGPLQLRAQHLAELTPDHANALTLSQDDPPAVLGVKVLSAAEPLLLAQVLGASSVPAPKTETPWPAWQQLLRLLLFAASAAFFRECWRAPRAAGAE